MSEWIDLIVYAALIFGVWGWLAWRSRVPVLLIADRNPDWIGAHPEVEQRLVGNGWFRWSCGLWGVVSLAILVAFQIGAWPELFALFRNGPYSKPTTKSSEFRSLSASERQADQVHGKNVALERHDSLSTV
jgi:hypothetical protein